MEELYTLSQVSITIAGFATLFTTLKPHRNNWDGLDNINLIRFYMMIELACMISVFSFLPVILLGYFDKAISFRLSFGIYSCIWLPYIIYATNRNKRYLGKVNITGISTIIIIALGIFALFFSMCCALNILGENYKTNYLILLYTSFLVNIYLFLRLIYFTIKNS